MRKIVFANQKGGVGKSTSCINIAGILGKQNKKILVIDLDPQANTTLGLGINWNELENRPTIYDCLLYEDMPLKNAIIQTKYENIDIIPSYITLANAEIELSSIIGRETLLRDKIRLEEGNYDYILIDLPPSLGILLTNGLVAADEIIIPIDTGVFAISGIQMLINVIGLIKKKLNPKLRITGVLFTKVDSRTKLSKELYEELTVIFEDKLLKTVIHNSIKIAEAQKEGKPLIYYDAGCKAEKEYEQLVEELLS